MIWEVEIFLGRLNSLHFINQASPILYSCHTLLPSIVAVWNIVNEAKTIAFKRLWLWHCRRITSNCPHTRDTNVWFRGSLHLAHSFNVTPRVQVCFDMVLDCGCFSVKWLFSTLGVWKIPSKCDLVSLASSFMASRFNALWQHPALSRRFDFPCPEMACGTLHLVPPPLVRPAYSESRAMTRTDCYWLNPFLRLVKQCCSRQNKIYFILKPLKLSVDQCFDILCARQEKNSNNLSLALSIFAIKTERTSNKRLQRAARFHIYKLC